MVNVLYILYSFDYVLNVVNFIVFYRFPIYRAVTSYDSLYEVGFEV